MDELERRLRSALTEMAEEVPPSHNAWAEQERRLALKARRSKRRPALMVAAAAAVVAMIVVPVLVLKSKPSPVDQADSPPPSPTTTPPSTGAAVFPPTADKPEYQALPGETITTLPVPIATSKDGLTTYVYTLAKNNQQSLCLSQAPQEKTGKAVVLDGAKKNTCVGLTPPRPGKVVWLQYGISDPENQGLYLYVASSPTDNILVRRAEGNYAAAYRLNTGKDFALFSAYLNSTQPPAAWTARDKQNATLENGG